MPKTPKYFIVDADALPDIFLKVAEAKRMLETGEADTVNLATRTVGISRSAFYKYKDAVRPFNDMLHGRNRHLSDSAQGRAGRPLGSPEYLCPERREYSHHHQGIPVNGCAAVTIGAETSSLELSLEDLLAHAMEVDGVVRCEILAG